MHIENVEAFSKWLIKELTPITDADPNALAKYVIALIRKPDKSVEELKQFSREQLDVFLGSHNSNFVDKVFESLLSKSYINEPEQSTLDQSPQNPETSTSRISEDPIVKESETRKSPKSDTESLEKTKVPKDEGKYKDAQNGGGSTRPVRKRISPPPPDNRDREKTEKPLQSRDTRDRRRSRSPRDRRAKQNTGRNTRSSPDRYRRRSRSRSRSQSPQKRNDRSKRRCKDFEERGYCIRGDHCPYYHGPDPVVVDENSLNSMVTLQPAADFSLPPPGYNPLNPPPPGVGIEYNPETPALTVNYSVPPPPIAGITTGQWTAPIAPQYGSQPAPFSVQQQQHTGQQQVYRGSGIRGRGSGRGGRGGGVGRGGFHGNINRDSSTLQVAKIPPELNTIAKLNEHFAAFGTVENIQVRFNGEPDSALITYSHKSEAFRAHKSPNPVLNNRFIKVFWHKPQEEDENADESSKQKSQPEPAKLAEKPKVASVKEAKFVSVEAQNLRKQMQDAKEKLSREKEQLANLVQFQQKQNELLEKWMTKQKGLLVKARTSTDEEEKKNATKLVKTVHKRIKSCKEEIDQLLMQISEKTMLVDEAIATIESLKGSTKKVGEDRKRKVDDGDDEIEKPNAKVGSVIIVKGVKEADVSDLMNHMEQFGETFDTNVKNEDGIATAIFPYKNSDDANKAITQGKVMNGIVLDMQLTNEQIDEIPSTDTNMTGAQLLASIPSGAESDDEDDN